MRGFFEDENLPRLAVSNDDDVGNKRSSITDCLRHRRVTARVANVTGHEDGGRADAVKVAGRRGIQEDRDPLPG